ncbi:hypothetical protein N431DRAFT_426644 [Stipitochalara longipes BDJ]|nr:hypothetical protein N431DRAFT_426644 [Stipitochalara longipes BDJ]
MSTISYPAFFCKSFLFPICGAGLASAMGSYEMAEGFAYFRNHYQHFKSTDKLVDLDLEKSREPR